MADPTLAALALEFVLLTDRLYQHCCHPPEPTEQHRPRPRPPRLPPPSEDDSIDATPRPRLRPRIH